MRKPGGTSKEGVKPAFVLGLRIQGGKITGKAILGEQGDLGSLSYTPAHRPGGRAPQGGRRMTESDCYEVAVSWSFVGLFINL